MMHRWKRVCTRVNATLSRAQHAPRTIMTTLRLKCFCNYKFRGAKTTTIFATNRFTWFRWNDGGEDAFVEPRLEALRECCTKHQNNVKHQNMLSIKPVEHASNKIECNSVNWHKLLSFTYSSDRFYSNRVPIFSSVRLIFLKYLF